MFLCRLCGNTFDADRKLSHLKNDQSAAMQPINEYRRGAFPFWEGILGGFFRLYSGDPHRAEDRSYPLGCKPVNKAPPLPCDLHFRFPIFRMGSHVLYFWNYALPERKQPRLFFSWRTAGVSGVRSKPQYSSVALPLCTTASGVVGVLS